MSTNDDSASLFHQWELERQRELDENPELRKWYEEHQPEIYGDNMSIKDLYPAKGNALKAEDLGNKEHTVKIAGNEVVEFDNGQKLILKFEGKEKTLVLNKTNASIIADTYGDDENKWNGKDIIIYPDKTTFGGKLVPCIRVRIPLVKADSEFDDDIPFK